MINTKNNNSQKQQNNKNNQSNNNSNQVKKGSTSQNNNNQGQHHSSQNNQNNNNQGQHHSSQNNNNQGQHHSSQNNQNNNNQGQHHSSQNNQNNKGQSSNNQNNKQNNQSSSNQQGKSNQNSNSNQNNKNNPPNNQNSKNIPSQQGKSNQNSSSSPNKQAQSQDNNKQNIQNSKNQQEKSNQNSSSSPNKQAQSQDNNKQNIQNSSSQQEKSNQKSIPQSKPEPQNIKETAPIIPPSSQGTNQVQPKPVQNPQSTNKNPDVITQVQNENKGNSSQNKQSAQVPEKNPLLSPKMTENPLLSPKMAENKVSPKSPKEIVSSNENSSFNKAQILSPIMTSSEKNNNIQIKQPINQQPQPPSLSGSNSPIKPNLNKELINSPTSKKEKGSIPLCPHKLKKQEENKEINKNDTKELKTIKKIIPIKQVPIEQVNVKTNPIPKDITVDELYQKSVSELKSILSDLNSSIVEYYDEQEKYKSTLSDLLSKLSEAFSIKQEENSKEEINNYFLKVYETRKKDLEISKKKKRQAKSRYELLSTQFNTTYSIEQLASLDTKINNLNKENKSLIVQIRELKDKNSLINKEMQVCIANKKYPAKLSQSSSEMYLFSTHKHDLQNRLEKAKKSLQSTINEFNKFEKLFNDIDRDDYPSWNEGYEDKITDWIDLFKKDLKGSIDDVISRIDNDKLSSLEILDKEIDKKKKNVLKLPEIDTINSNSNTRIYNSALRKTRSYVNVMNSNSDIDTIDEKVKVVKKRAPYIDILGAFKYLKICNTFKNQSKNNGNLTEKTSSNIGTISTNSIFKNTSVSVDKGKIKVLFSKNKKLQRKGKEIQEGNKSNNLMTTHTLNIILNEDYENTTDEMYSELLEKKEEMEMKINHINQTIKEHERIEDRKMKDTTNTIEINTKKLNTLKETNQLLKKEVQHLKEVYALTKQQNDIKNEMRNNESKLIKGMNNNTNVLITSNNYIDQNNTENNILNDLSRSGRSIGKKKNEDSIYKKSGSYLKNQNEYGYDEDY